MTSPALAPPLRVADAQLLPVELAAPTQAQRAVATGQAAAAQPEAAVHIELRRGSSSLMVRWPMSATGECAAWLRELASGLLK